MDNSVRQHREQEGLTQQELADRLGVTRQTISAIETGRYDPSLELGLRMAELFGVSVEELFSVEG